MSKSGDLEEPNIMNRNVDLDQHKRKDNKGSKPIEETQGPSSSNTKKMEKLSSHNKKKEEPSSDNEEMEESRSDNGKMEDKSFLKQKDPPSDDEKEVKANDPSPDSSKEGMLALIIQKTKKHWKKTFCVIITVIILIYAALIGHIFNLNDRSWSEWDNWSQCSAPCGYGLRSRIRKCSSIYCHGQNVEYQICHLITCTDGIWSEWGNWSQCSATCGYGLRSRIRTCSVDHCPGQNVEYQSCNLITCTGDIAAFSWKFKIQNGILTFPDRPHDNGKIYEHGKGFNPDTGVFTCSKPGIYLFSVTLVKEESNSNLTCHLYKTEPYPSSNQLISLILNSSNYSSNSFSYASATVIVELKRNDTVYISRCSASSSSSKAYSVFSGVLLHQII